MKKEIKEIAIADAIVLVVLVLFSLFPWARNGDNLTLSLSGGFLFIAATNGFFGICLLLISLFSSKSSVRRYGAAMLLIAGISFLCGFTFCSIGLRHSLKSH